MGNLLQPDPSELQRGGQHSYSGNGIHPAEHGAVHYNQFSNSNHSTFHLSHDLNLITTVHVLANFKQHLVFFNLEFLYFNISHKIQ